MFSVWGFLYQIRNLKKNWSLDPLNMLILEQWLNQCWDVINNIIMHQYTTVANWHIFQQCLKHSEPTHSFDLVAISCHTIWENMIRKRTLYIHVIQGCTMAQLSLYGMVVDEQHVPKIQNYCTKTNNSSKMAVMLTQTIYHLKDNDTNTFRNDFWWELTHWGLLTPHGDRDLGQHWLR